MCKKKIRDSISQGYKQPTGILIKSRKRNYFLSYFLICQEWQLFLWNLRFHQKGRAEGVSGGGGSYSPRTQGGQDRVVVKVFAS